MSEFDITKEQIAYLKFWLGIMVVTDISLIGWLITHVDQSGRFLVVITAIAGAAITTGIALLHRRIERHIKTLRSL